MKITVITLFPNMITPFFAESIVSRAQKKGLINLNIVNLRDYALDSYGTVDDRPYGGGAGMVLRIEPIVNALKAHSDIAKKNAQRRILITSPQGSVFTQQKAGELAQMEELVLIAGHYEAVDERVLQYVDEEVSMGDFVMTGGEIPAAAIVDSVVRLIPGVLKKSDATEQESFFSVPLETIRSMIGNNAYLDEMQKKGRTVVTLLEYPHYTRPEQFENQIVPSELLSGDPKKIYAWEMRAAWDITMEKRPDLLK